MQTVQQFPKRSLHRLREIDAEKRSAVCAICGPTAVYRSDVRGNTTYRCATHLREFERQKRTAHIVNPYATVHVLSDIDEVNRTATCAKCGPVKVEWKPIPEFQFFERKNKRELENTRIVSDYVSRQACKRCGSMAIVGPGGFQFFELHLPKEQRIWALVRKADPEELLAELEKRDLYCKKCHWRVTRSFKSKAPVPEIRTVPTLF